MVVLQFGIFPGGFEWTDEGMQSESFQGRLDDQRKSPTSFSKKNKFRRAPTARGGFFLFNKFNLFIYKFWPGEF